MRVVGKCDVCGKNGYVNNISGLCRKCQNEREYALDDRIVI